VTLSCAAVAAAMLKAATKTAARAMRLMMIPSSVVLQELAER
jgi:hypothetical protein